MKILIISDSHYRNVTKLDLKSYDYIIHAGDIRKEDYEVLSKMPNCYLVRGNCDFYAHSPLELEFSINGKSFYLTHSHLYNSKEGYHNLIKKAKDFNYDFLIFGHTHNSTAFYEGKTLLINPGSYMEGSYMELIDNDLYIYTKKNLWSLKEKYHKKLLMKL